MEAFYPNSYLDVVEIDPKVTRIVYTHMGLPHSTRIRTFNEDGRWFVMNTKEKYDIVFIDAYNDLSIPYHLTTKEFAGQIRNLLKPNGIVLTNIIDNFQKGAFLPSYMRTLQEVFGDKNVHLISIRPQFEKIGTSTFIVLTGGDELNIKGFESFIKSRLEGRFTSAVVPESLTKEFIKRNPSVILKDDYAPVDNLIAPVFEERFGYNRKYR